MRKHFGILFTLILCLSLIGIFAVSDEVTGANGPYTISGQVTDEESGDPIGGVPVRVVDEEWNPVAVTVTDGGGLYAFPFLPAGTYMIRTTLSKGNPASYYVDEWWDNAIPRQGATPVIVGPSRTDIHFALAIGGRIEGVVTEEGSDPPIFIPGLHVYAEDYDTGEWKGGGNTNEFGEYTFVVPAEPEGSSYGVRACPSCGGPNPDLSWFVNEWYDDTIRREEASEVVVEEGSSTVPPINFDLIRGGQIQGTVIVEESEPPIPIPDLHVYVEDYDTGEWMGGTDTNEDGEYTLTLPAHREYRVRACATCPEEPQFFVNEYFQDTLLYDDAEPVGILYPMYLRDEVDFELEPAGFIKGRVTNVLTEDPITDLHVHAFDEEHNWMAGDNTDPDGYYILALPLLDEEEDGYIVRTCAQCDDRPYLDRIYNNVVRWDDAELVPVEEGVPNDGIDFELPPMFTEFTIEEMSIEFGEEAGDDGIEIAEATLQLPPEADFDPEDHFVIVSIDMIPTRIPEGAFRQMGNSERYIYQSIGGERPIVQMVLDFEEGEWSFRLQHVDASMVDNEDGIRIVLIIGEHNTGGRIVIDMQAKELIYPGRPE